MPYYPGRTLLLVELEEVVITTYRLCYHFVQRGQLWKI